MEGGHSFILLGDQAVGAWSLLARWDPESQGIFPESLKKWMAEFKSELESTDLSPFNWFPVKMNMDYFSET